MNDITSKLRNDKLWKDVYNLTEYIYAKNAELIVNFPDEQWATASKLRTSANDSLFYTSQAVGSANKATSRYEWDNARRNLFALQSMYTFAARQKFFELEPEIIVKIDNLLSKIDDKIAEAKQEADKQNNEELEPWLEKYRIWQDLQK